jgi:hypothetical protein
MENGLCFSIIESHQNSCGKPCMLQYFERQLHYLIIDVCALYSCYTLKTNPFIQACKFMLCAQQNLQVVYVFMAVSVVFEVTLQEKGKHNS